MKTAIIANKVSAILKLAGLAHAPGQGFRLVGNTIEGQAIYSSDQLSKSIDITAGAKLLFTLASFIAPFNVLTKKEKEALEYVAKTSKDTRLLDKLDKDYLNRNITVFSKTLLSAIKANTSHAAGIISANALFSHWSVMSVAQKSLSIAAIGLQTHEATDEGGPTCDLKIIDGKDQVFTVQDALDLLKTGKNPYGLVQNWEQIRKLHAVFGGKPTVEAMSDFAISHNLLGKGTNDAVVSGVTKNGIKQVGAKPSPQFGVGALAISKGMSPPNGYSQAASLPGGEVVVPTANAQSAAGAVQNSLINTSAGKGGASAGASDVYSKWGKDKKTVDKGADGGSALIAGATQFKRSNPYLYGAMVAFLTQYSKDYVTYSTAIEYAACLAGVTLARLVTGKREKIAEQEGIALVRRIHDTTPGEYAKIQLNLRGLYASFGISSKADAYQLTNQAYAEERIEELDLVAMEEILDIVFDDNTLDAAQKLLNGKDRGIEIISDATPPAHNTMTQGKIQNNKIELEQNTKEELRQKNAVKYAQEEVSEEGEGVVKEEVEEKVSEPTEAPQAYEGAA